MNERKEDELLIEGHDYDGIQELDNALPTWWLYLFYLTVAFGFAYIVYFHVMGRGGSAEQYAAEMAAAESAKAAAAPPSAGGPDAAAIAAVNAGQLFMTNCMPCHGPDGRGIIGPNLTDDYWVHGCSMEEVVTTINKGVPEKGMIAWATVLKPAQVHALAQYILDLRGTSPENPKAPEGQPCGDGVAPTTSPAPDIAAVVPGPAPEAVPAPTPAGEGSEGSKIFMTNCMPCHGPDGRGIVGPNLTDDYWVHGCSLEDVVKTITVGVPLKGMISWAPVLKPEQIEAVAQYILDMRGTTPESPKAPEGEICTPE
ncbi:MAG: mono/diheme cytochrome c family protein, partial [Rhodothermales bacterium]